MHTGAEATNFQLVSSAGTCKSSALLGKYIDGECQSLDLDDSSPIPIIGVLNLGSNVEAPTINKIFQTTFGNINSGISLELTSGKVAVLNCGFDKLVSSKFCGVKAIEYCSAIADSICFISPGIDLVESLAGYDQIFRVLFSKLTLPGRKLNIRFLVDAKKEDDANMEKHILTYLQSVWDDVVEKVPNLI
jgi:hypothetical protein